MPTATSEIGGNAYAFVILGRSRSEAKCGDPGIHAVTLKSLGGAEYCRSPSGLRALALLLRVAAIVTRNSHAF
ncbi:protein of unknown function [Aminobacter niigataensis]|nr:protein of unknown function [Aminobacter niigataensis]